MAAMIRAECIAGKKVFVLRFTFGSNIIIGLFFSQHLYMRDDAFGDPVQPVTALQHRYEAALAEFFSKLDHYARDSCETGRSYIKDSEQIVPHAIKAGANQDEIGLEISRCRNELCLKRLDDLCI